VHGNIGKTCPYVKSKKGNTYGKKKDRRKHRKCPVALPSNATLPFHHMFHFSLATQERTII
jgi:hypothetical protein